MELRIVYKGVTVGAQNNCILRYIQLLRSVQRGNIFATVKESTEGLIEIVGKKKVVSRLCT